MKAERIGKRKSGDTAHAPYSSGRYAIDRFFVRFVRFVRFLWFLGCPVAPPAFVHRQMRFQA